MMMTKASRRARVMIALAAASAFSPAARPRPGWAGAAAWVRADRGPGARLPSTSTAPGAASPIQRSQIPNQGPAINRPATAAPAAQAGPFRLRNGPDGRPFGAGLLGMLMGNGFFGGLAGLASVFGLLLQVGLVVLLVSFAMKWFRKQAAGARLCGSGSRPLNAGLCSSGRKSSGRARRRHLARSRAAIGGARPWAA